MLRLVAFVIVSLSAVLGACCGAKSTNESVDGPSKSRLQGPKGYEVFITDSDGWTTVK